MPRVRPGQSMLEYAALMMIVSFAVVVMSAYFWKASNARLENIREELDYYRY